MEEIESGIQGFFESEGDYLITLMRKYVCEQIFLSGCAVNIESETDDPAVLTIEIDIPDPDTCVDRIDNIGAISMLDI